MTRHPTSRMEHAPAAYRRRFRTLGEVRVLALHQMACGGSWAEDSPAWDRVAAHFVVKRSGEVQQNHPELARLSVGSGPRWNPSCVSVELAGNLPVRRRADGSWVWWKGERFGRDLLTEAQVEGARELIRWLRWRLPDLSEVGPHRLVDRRKAGCCGPHAWAEVGAWAVAEGMRVARTEEGGLDIPADWWPVQAAPGSVGATEAGRAGGCGREYAGPLGAALEGSEASPFEPYPPHTPSGAPPLAP